jgi:uncharacterized protein YyaL (SSP411 family)
MRDEIVSIAENVHFIGAFDPKKNTRLQSANEEKILKQAVQAVAGQYDRKNGGFASRPKFPEASKLELLLDMYALENDKHAYQMAAQTLKKMALGGIYDQIGGGFFRYTTDDAWQIPHFEKMLYTNAELIPLYVRLYERTKEPLYKQVVDETIAHMETHFLKSGVYLSASDADSDGEEGGYFIYAYEEVKKALLLKGMDVKEVEDALAYLGIEEDGNIDGDFSHTHITHAVKPVKLNEVKRFLKERLLDC